MQQNAKTFFYVVLPILQKPIYVTILILNGIWIWNDFPITHFYYLVKCDSNITNRGFKLRRFIYKTMGYDLSFNITHYVTSYYPIHSRTKNIMKGYGLTERLNLRTILALDMKLAMFISSVFIIINL